MTHKLSKAGQFTLLAVASTTIMVGCVIVPGLPGISQQLGVQDAASWLVTLPSLGVVLFGALAARLIGRLGSRAALCLGLFAYGLLGIAGAYLEGRYAVFADRIVLGGATAVIMAAGTDLISQFFAGDARTAMIARQGMAIELGGVLFLAAGGSLAAIGWQWPFALYLFSWLLLAMVAAFVPRLPRIPGSATAADASPAAAAASSTPLPPLVKVAYAAALCSMVLFFTAIITLPGQLHALGVSEAQTGYFLSFVSLMAVVAAAVMPFAMRRLQPHGTLCLAFCCYAVAHLIFGAFHSLPCYVAGAIAMGMGFGLSVPTVNVVTIDQSAPAQRGTNLVYLSMAIFSGQFLSSFMEWIPGSVGTAFIAALAAVLLALAMVTVARKMPGAANKV
jgi:MFS family permease